MKEMLKLKKIPETWIQTVPTSNEFDQIPYFMELHVWS